MKLLAFGDSFVEGLIKEPRENSVKQRDAICFTRRLAETSELFDSYANYGTRGSGNESIFYNAYKHSSYYDNDNSFYLICLSGLERVGFYDKNLDSYSIPNRSVNVPFEPFFQTQMLMTGLHYYLKNKNIPHLFTSSFTPFYMFYNKDTIPEEYIIGDVDKSNSLFDIIADRFNKDTDYFGNYQTSHVDFKVPKSKYIAQCLHPSTKGHKLIATTLLPYIEDHLLKLQSTQFEVD